MENEMNVNTETEVKEEVVSEESAAEETKPEKTFTQAEVDELIQKRIAREIKKYEKKLNQPSQEQLSLEDENKNLKDNIASLNKQILNYEAGKIAGTLNVKSDRLDAFLRLADLSQIELDSEGTYKDEIKEILEGVAKEFPEFLKITETKPVGEIKVGAAPAKLDDIELLRQQIRQGLDRF